MGSDKKEQLGYSILSFLLVVEEHPNESTFRAYSNLWVKYWKMTRKTGIVDDEIFFSATPILTNFDQMVRKYNPNACE